MKSNARYDVKITAGLKSCQAQTSFIVKNNITTTFGERVLCAFRTAGLTTKKNEIRELLKLKSPSTVTGWMKAESGGSYPETKTLLKIAEITKCNLHWLLTGEGEESTNNLNFLHPNELDIVKRLSRLDEQTEGEVVAALVIEALARRAADTFIAHNQLKRINEHDRKQLAILYSLVLDRASGEQPKLARPDNRQSA